MADRHHLDREFALPTTQRVLESLGAFTEPGTIRRDSIHERANHRVIRFWDAGEGQLALDAGDEARPVEIAPAVGEPVPTWHFRGKR